MISDVFLVINGEKAAFNTPVFAQKRQRTLEMLLHNLYQDQMPENNKVYYIIIDCIESKNILDINNNI